MKIYRGVEQLTESPEHAVVTIGNFDGVHLGHQRIIQLALEKARARGGKTVAFTFKPHPQVALRPQVSLPLLSTYEEKLEILGTLGLDFVIEQPFSREFSTIQPEQFFRDILLRRLNAEAIVVGYDFGFGKGREGHLEVLGKLCEEAGVELTIVQPQREDSEVVSSSRVRSYLLAGDVEQAAKLLGRPFSYKGVVRKGDGRGRTIGFPTANLKLDNKLALPNGVYATQTLFAGKLFPSVTNIGVRPTFTSASPVPDEFPAWVETHLLDTEVDLYGSTLTVQFIQRLRSEMKFSGVDALVEQIRRDIDGARALIR